MLLFFPARKKKNESFFFRRKTAYTALGDKLRPQVYELGFLKT